jgi:hypothetical protein
MRQSPFDEHLWERRSSCIQRVPKPGGEGTSGTRVLLERMSLNGATNRVLELANRTGESQFVSFAPIGTLGDGRPSVINDQILDPRLGDQPEVLWINRWGCEFELTATMKFRVQALEELGANCAAKLVDERCFSSHRRSLTPTSRRDAVADNSLPPSTDRSAFVDVVAHFEPSGMYQIYEPSMTLSNRTPIST